MDRSYINEALPQNRHRAGFFWTSRKPYRLTAFSTRPFALARLDRSSAAREFGR